MIKNAAQLKPGDRRIVHGLEWTVEGAEMQDGLVQVLWRRGDERRWDEYDSGTPLIVTEVAEVRRIRLIKNAADLAVGDRHVGKAMPPYGVTAIECAPNRVTVEWTNESGMIRIKQYDPSHGVLVESIIASR